MSMLLAGTRKASRYRWLQAASNSHGFTSARHQAHALSQPVCFGGMPAVYCERPRPLFCKCPDCPEHEQHVHFNARLGYGVRAKRKHYRADRWMALPF